MIAAIQNMNSRKSLTLFSSGDTANDKRELAAWFGIMAQETTGGSITASASGSSCQVSGASWCKGTTGEGCLDWGLCWVEETGCGNCPGYGGTALSGHTYHGRGPKQLSWNYNYKAFSQYYCGDDILLNYPERVAANSELAWASSIWFWVTGGPDNTKPGCHDVFTRTVSTGNRNPGLGWAINIVNGGLECYSANRCDRRVASRVEHYKRYCTKFGVAALKPEIEATATTAAIAGWTENDNLYCSTQDNYR